MLRTIHVMGELGEKYGCKFKLDVLTVGEAIRAINTNCPGFINDIKKDENYNVTVGEFTEEKALDGLSIRMQHKEGDIWICPAIIGKKQGIFQSVLGAILVVVGVVLSVYGFGIGSPLIKLGAGLMISGVAMMLTPVPGVPDYSGREDPDERASFLFDGAINTNEQGGAIPIVYGQMLIGSTVVSTAMDVEDI